MILDKLENLKNYKMVYLSKVIDYIGRTDLSSLEPGTHMIDGENLFVNVVDRVLEKEPTSWEVHKKYIDVHVMISGKERIGYSKGTQLVKTTEYSEQKDASHYEGISYDSVYYVLEPEDVMVFFPGEIHIANGPSNADFVKKAIFKVKF